MASIEKIAGTGSNVQAGGYDWINPNSITAEANASHRSGAGNSDRLTGSNFGFAIPTDATILGIELILSKYPWGGFSVADVDVKLNKGGSAVGDNKAKSGDWAINQNDYTYGSSTDLWGTTWTPAEINASGFGAYIKCTKVNSGDAAVYYMYIKVFYTPSSSIKSINGLAKASIKSRNGLAIASIKSINGLQ